MGRYARREYRNRRLLRYPRQVAGAPANGATMRLAVVPMTWREAERFCEMHHRHHPPPRGGKFALGVVDDQGKLRGVALCGRPVARAFDDGLTLEVNRTATDGCPNANSALYGACWRVACAMGYRKLLTYTQAGETGASLTAAGFVKLRDLQPRGSWAQSSVKLAHLRNPVGAGGVQRTLWERRDTLDRSQLSTKLPSHGSI